MRQEEDRSALNPLDNVSSRHLQRLNEALNRLQASSSMKRKEAERMKSGIVESPFMSQSPSGSYFRGKPVHSPTFS